MGDTQQLSVTLPRELAEQIEKKVESGAYASASEVVSEGVRTLLDRDLSLDQWLRTEVVKGIAEYRTDPSTATPASEIKQRIQEMAAHKRGR